MLPEAVMSDSVLIALLALILPSIVILPDLSTVSWGLSSPFFRVNKSESINPSELV